MNRILLAGIVLAVAAAALYLVAPAPKSGGVVVYSSVDAEYARALAERFTQATGIEVQLKLDSEASKTTGLVGELRDKKDRPDGDVFWNSELSGMLLLARDGALDAYDSKNAASIPAAFKDAQGRWTGFGLRARVLVYNTTRVKADEAPRSLEELADPKWRGRFCVARPLFGTTRSHFAALVLALGEERGFELLRKIRDNAGEREWIVDGNAAVRDRVAEGTFDAGLTDTDDVYAAQRNGRPVEMVFLEQTAAWPGVFLIPNTVAVLRGGPHPQAARAFVDFLLSAETEAWLAEQGARQIPVRAEVPVPEGAPALKDLAPAAVDFEALGAQIEALSERIDKVLRGVEK